MNDRAALALQARAPSRTGGDIACALVPLNFKSDPMTDLEVTMPARSTAGDQQKYLTAIVGMNVSASLFNIEPPDCSDLHGLSSLDFGNSN